MYDRTLMTIAAVVLGGIAGLAIGGLAVELTRRLVRRGVLCRLGWHLRCTPESNHYYLWCRCIDCGKRCAEISRYELRERMKREL